MKKHANIFGIILLTCGFAISSIASSPKKIVPKNIIFMIVDGMGPGQIEASEIYMGGKKIRFREFPHQGEVTTHNIFGEVTDSAAAATAMATGQKVSDGVISKKIPGDKSKLKTVFHKAKELGKSTGLVTNAPVTHATPASFAAHAESRKNDDEILRDYFTQTFPNVIFGADEPQYREHAKKSRVTYQIATSKTELEKIVDLEKSKTCTGKKCPHFYGGFGSHAVLPGIISWEALPLEADSETFATRDIPRLSEMAKSAIALLSQNKNGFFLMLESGLVDWIGHTNQLFSNETEKTSSAFALAKEFAEINRTVDVFLEFQKSNPDTLIIVTSDHETGGLVVDSKNTTCLGEDKCLAKMNWTAPLYETGEKIAKHTGVNVGVFAKGPGAEVFGLKDGSPMDNTEFAAKIFGSSLQK